MIDDYLNQDAYRVVRGNHELYDGLTAATLTLTGSLPAVNFRVAVTLSSVTGHTDCAGSVVVGTETLTFTAATKKTTTKLLSALPVVTTSGLDCSILVEATTASGAPITEETSVAIKTRFSDAQKAFLNAAGVWEMSQAIAYVNDSNCNVGTKYSHGGYDYTIDQVKAPVDLEGDEVFRKLYLGSKTVAPADRAVSVSAETELGNPVMLIATYDADADGIVDRAEGIQVLDEIPSDLSEYEDGDMFKVADVVYVVHDA